MEANDGMAALRNMNAKSNEIKTNPYSWIAISGTWVW